MKERKKEVKRNMAANGEIIYNVKFKTDLGQLENSLKRFV